MGNHARASSLRRLSAALLAFYSLDDGVSFSERALRCLTHLVDADIVAYTEWNSRGEIVAMTSTPKPVELQEFLQTFGRFEHEHPCLQHIHQTGDPSALRLTDFISVRELRQTGLYHEFFRLHEINRSMGLVALDDRGGRFSAGFNRRGKDFSEEDKLLLNLVRPHLQQGIQKYRRLMSQSPPSNQRELIQSRLTGREREVMHWVEQGKSNWEIGIILRIASSTVAKHLERSYEKLGVETRTAAVAAIRSVAT